jgi:hypothetical protein
VNITFRSPDAYRTHQLICIGTFGSTEGRLMLTDTGGAAAT